MNAHLVQKLFAVDAFSYFRLRSMPDFVEPSIRQLLAEFRSASSAEREAFLIAWPHRTCPALAWFARRGAGMAVRRSNRTDLEDALLAVVFFGQGADRRDCMAPLALIEHAANRLGEDVAELLGRIHLLAGKRANSVLETFQKIPAADRTIGAFGFSEGVGPEGFDYLPLLPEYGGPTPLG